MNIAEEMKRFAAYHHRNQVRDFTGAPYFTHLERVRQCVLDHLDGAPGINTPHDVEIAEAISWGHDLIEDTKKNQEIVTYDVIKSEFGEEVAIGILELTNVYTTEDFPNMNRANRKKAERDRISQISDRSRFIKLCDRYDNITSYEREDPEWGAKHYYIPETELLLTALIGVHTGLYNELRAVLETAKRN